MAIALNQVIVWGCWIVLIIFVFVKVILPLFKKTEQSLKGNVREFNIKQIKRSIKDMNIKKWELFDE